MPLVRKPLPPLCRDDVWVLGFLYQRYGSKEKEPVNCIIWSSSWPHFPVKAGSRPLLTKNSYKCSWVRGQQETSFLVQHSFWPKLILKILMSKVGEQEWLQVAIINKTNKPQRGHHELCEQPGLLLCGNWLSGDFENHEWTLAEKPPAHRLKVCVLHFQALEQEGQGCPEPSPTRIIASV